MESIGRTICQYPTVCPAPSWLMEQILAKEGEPKGPPLRFRPFSSAFTAGLYFMMRARS
jgi:hypothetical protein